MGTATGLTATRMLAIEAASVVDGEVIGDDLHLYTHGGSDINAGNVRGPVGPSAANPVPWDSATAYTTGAIVGYAGVLWKCKANNTNHPPHLYSTEWEAIEGFDYTSQWASKDAYFLANDPTVGWEFFWKTGTSTVSLTTTSGEFETGDQALKVALAVSSSQTMYMKNENIVRGGETVNVIVRAKLRVAAAGATINAGAFQNDAAGPPAPFGTGSSNVGSNEGVQSLTTNWKTYMFTITMVNGKSRAVPYLSLVTAAGAAADVLIDRVEISRNKAQSSAVVNVPVGTVMAWTSATIPNGWLPLSGPLATGVASRTAYPELFALIGTTYGAGDGSTTFGLPNFVGRAPMGQYPSGPYAANLGSTGGEALHTLTIAEMPSHTHDQNVLANGVAGSGQRVDYAGDRAFAGSFPQGVTTGPTGGGAAHNVLDPYSTVIFIIRALPTAGVDRATTQFFKGSPAVNGATVIAANTNIDLTVRNDPNAGWDSTNKRWIVQQPGRYRISAAYEATAASAGRRLRILKNGTAIAASVAETANGQLGGVINEVFELLPGDQIAVQATAGYTTAAPGAGIENNYLIIQTIGLEGTPIGLSDSGWVNLQLLNGWVNYDSGLSIGGSGRAARVRKVNGIVFLEGVIRSGTLGANAFQLPVGYRPTPTTIYERSAAVNSAGAFGLVNIDATTGNTTTGGSNVYCYLLDCWIAGA
jgi:microcystin-dependent protein